MLLSNNGGYRVTETVIYDGQLDATNDPLTLLCTTFKPNVESKFRFTVHYKHE